MDHGITFTALCSDQVDDLAVCSMQLAEGVPEWVHLLPVGEIKSVDGREWTNDDSAAVVRASESGVDLVIDYEHQTDLAAQNGQKAPAAGWISRLEARADGIWGKVAWTTAAREHLENREYRYLSPTFMYAKDGQARKILRAALTNHPAIHTLTALATSDHTEESIMDELLKALAKALGMDEGAEKDAILAKIATLHTTALATAPIITALCTALDIKADEISAETLETALASHIGSAATATGAKSVQPNPEEFVDMASFQGVAAQLKQLQDEGVEQKSTAAVEAAIKAGKVTPAQRTWATAYAKQNLDGFNAFVENQPVIVDGDGTVIGKPQPGGNGLSADEIAICSTLGISEDQFLENRKASE